MFASMKLYTTILPQYPAVTVCMYDKYRCLYECPFPTKNQRQFATKFLTKFPNELKNILSRSVDSRYVYHSRLAANG